MNSSKSGLLRPLLPLGLGLCLMTSAAAAEEAAWQLAMNDVEIRDVVREVGSILDQTIILDPRVQGRITVFSSERLEREGVRRLFYSVLNAQGFAAVNDGDRLLIIPAAEAKAWANQQASGISTAFTTQVFELSNSVAADLAGLLRPLVSTNGYIGPSSSANALVVTDSQANLQRVARLISELDGGQQHEHELVQLRHAVAADLVKIIETSLGKGDSTIRVLADTRGNRLLILGPAKVRQRLARLARSLDTPSHTTAHNWRVIRLRHADAGQLAEILGEVGKRLDGKDKPDDSRRNDTAGQAMVRADESQNALILIADPQQIRSIEQIVEQLDQPRAQVLIHAAIVEVSGDISEALGLQWGINRGDFTGGVNFPDSGISLPGLLGGADSVLPSGAALAIGSDRFAVLISALASNTRSNLLSTPSLLTLDNQEAEILVGQNVPFQTGSYTTSGNGADNPFTTVERKDIGISLKIKPHINDGTSLRLEVEQESSEVAPSRVNTDIITNKRALKSTILAADGEIIVIGGLIKDTVRTEHRSVPLLGRLPLIGGLFRWNRDTQEKTNLMVFLRPTIVRSHEALIQSSRQTYDNLRQSGEDQGLPQDARDIFDGRRQTAPKTLEGRP
ncbi:type II secretion system secretin GspD [Pseudomonas akapageensis]|uniref:type II secretion system secretin GspD n=1 Tax=Pseudomonas akapageensis TaxID=2609961 RepID=UPI00140D5813|nr:type II secretion system secretin GspD [Pseudomonas akapageensis]